MFSSLPSKSSILLVDDEPSVLQLLSDILSHDFDCIGVGSAEAALSRLAEKDFGLVISDINLGGMSGVEMLPHIHSVSPDTVVMMISGNLTLDSPIEAMRHGAFDYIRKPFNIPFVIAAARRALEHHQLLVAKRKHDEELEKLVEERTAQLQFLTYHDALTNLPNRALVEDRLGQILVNTDGGCNTAIMMVAIGRLRTVRETFGHDAANKIVNEVANRISGLLEPNATLGRLDGDHFAILLPETTPEQVLHWASTLTEVFSSSFQWMENSLHLHSKIGISLHPGDGDDAKSLLLNAASALGHTRPASGSSFEFYSKSINTFAADRLSLENDLRNAIRDGELSVHYQPKIETDSGRITGMEALARWNHPTRGKVRPDVFIGLAEDLGIIDRIGEWILRSACLQTRKWREAGFDLELAANLSGLQLQDERCAEQLLTVLHETAFDPIRLNLEITETAVMKDLATSISALTELREYGVKVSIDDFGTGYSSLKAFKQLPIDVLKIDRTFVKDLAENPADVAFARTIVELAHIMGVKVVAEGVETEAQLAVLTTLGCDEWQGFLCSKPLPADEFFQLISKSSHKQWPSVN